MVTLGACHRTVLFCHHDVARHFRHLEHVGYSTTNHGCDRRVGGSRYLSIAIMLSSLTQESRFANFAWFAVWAMGHGAWVAILFSVAVGKGTSPFDPIVTNDPVSQAVVVAIALQQSWRCAVLDFRIRRFQPNLRKRVGAGRSNRFSHWWFCTIEFRLPFESRHECRLQNTAFTNMRQNS